MIAPHTAPSARIGAPTPLLSPSPCAIAAFGPGTCVVVLDRAARAVRRTRCTTPSPSTAMRMPTCMTCRTGVRAAHRHDHGRPAALEAQQRGEVAAEQPARLVGDGVEHGRLPMRRRRRARRRAAAPPVRRRGASRRRARRAPAPAPHRRLSRSRRQPAVSARRAASRRNSSTAWTRRCSVSAGAMSSLRRIAVTCFSTAASLTNSDSRDAEVRLALGHRGEDVALARRQRAQRSPRTGPSQHPADHLGVERAPPGRHAADGVDERRSRSRPAP